MLCKSFRPETIQILAMINESDVRSMVRLLGEVAAMDGDHAVKKRCLLDGLCGMINARAWVWGLVLEPTPHEQPVFLSFLYGGFDEKRFADFLQALDHPDLAEYTAPFLLELKRRQAHTTRMRQQIDPTNRFLLCDAYPLWIKAGVYPGIISSRPVDATSMSTIAIYRSPDEPPYSERDLRLAHIILSEVPWLHEQGWPDDRGVTVPRLSLRQRQTLNLLLQGFSRKQIADSLTISLHTVGDYIKDVYRHFGVQSQAELMHRFLSGDGGDHP